MTLVKLGDAMIIWQQAQEIRFAPDNRHLFNGTRTGIEAIDDYGRLQHPFYGLVVARNKAGKTAFMLTLALAFAKAGYVVYYDSLEMLLYDMCNRVAGNASYTNMNQYIQLKATGDDWYRTQAAIDELQSYNFYLDDQDPAITPDQFDNRIETLRAWHPGQRILGIIDYLSLMRHPKADTPTRNVEMLSWWARMHVVPRGGADSDLTPERMLNIDGGNVVSIITASQIPASVKRAKGERITIDSAMYSSVYGNDCGVWWCINDVEDVQSNTLPIIKEVDVAGRNLIGGTAKVQFNRGQARYEDVGNAPAREAVL